MFIIIIIIIIIIICLWVLAAVFVVHVFVYNTLLCRLVLRNHVHNHALWVLSVTVTTVLSQPL